MEQPHQLREKKKKKKKKKGGNIECEHHYNYMSDSYISRQRIDTSLLKNEKYLHDIKKNISMRIEPEDIVLAVDV